MARPLPGILAEIAAVAGEPAALLISARVGGRRVYVPARVDDGHWLVDCVGRAKADKLCAHFTVDGRGQRIDVPLYTGGVYPRLRRAVAKMIHDLNRSGRSSRDIAGEVGVTTRTIHRHRAAHRGHKGGAQGTLF